MSELPQGCPKRSIENLKKKYYWYNLMADIARGPSTEAMMMGGGPSETFNRRRLMHYSRAVTACSRELLARDKAPVGYDDELPDMKANLKRHIKNGSLYAKNALASLQHAIERRNAKRKRLGE